VSKRHAVFREEDGEWIVEDAGSSNGIALNGEEVTRGVLSDGDKVGVGPYTLTFYAQTPSDESDEGDLDAEEDLAALLGSIDGVIGDDREVACLTSMSSAVPVSGFRTVDETKSPEVLMRRLKASYVISQATASTLEQSALLNSVLGALFDIFDTAERAFILLVDTERHEVKAGAVKRRDVGSTDAIAVSRTALNEVLRKHEALLCMDAMQDNLLGDAHSVAALGIRSLMIAPLLAHEELYGAIYVDTVDASMRYTEDDLELLSAAAAQVAGALSNLEMHKKVLDVERLAAVGQTVAGLSHCIKNILQGIKGGAYILDKGLETDNPERVAKGWAMVKRKNDFMEELVWDLLTYSKPRAPEYGTADLNELCEEVCEIGRERIEGDTVTVEFDAAPGLRPVELDAKGIRRCVLNLVSNAVDACSESGGKVTVHAKKADHEHVEIVVRDTGCGMPQETIDKLFGVFFSTKGSRGTGLGLPITKKIIEEHGGQILVDSVEDVGTAFTVKLPVSRPVDDTRDMDTLA